MAISKFAPVYNEFLDYLVNKATPEEILAFKPSKAAQDRADYLTDQNKADSLTDGEKTELEQLMEFDSLISVLKAKALISLKA